MRGQLGSSRADARLRGAHCRYAVGIAFDLFEAVDKDNAVSEGPRKAGVVLANLQTVWRAATPDEQQELCQIILKQVVYDFGTGKIVSVIPKPEYEVLFGLMGRE